MNAKQKTYAVATIHARPLPDGDHAYDLVQGIVSASSPEEAIGVRLGQLPACYPVHSYAVTEVMK